MPRLQTKLFGLAFIPCLYVQYEATGPSYIVEMLLILTENGFLMAVLHTAVEL